MPSLYAAEPIYDTIDGWDESTKGVTRFDQLNSNARKGLEYLKKKLDIPISMVSTGPNREETIIR
jgi:adenylosuccinate synthase